MPPKKKRLTQPKDVDSYDFSELDIEAMLSEVEEANFDAKVLDELKGERDFGVAKNIVEFITEPSFSYLGQEPFAKQVELLTKFLEEYCPGKKCTDRQFWREVPVEAKLSEIRDRVTFLEHGICPNKHCRKTKRDWAEKGRFHYVTELNAAIGMRASKTTMAGGMLAPYYAHRVIMLPQTPSRYYGLLEGKTLHMSFVSLTAKQVQDTLWGAFRDTITVSKWFKRYLGFLEERGQELGQELVRNNATFLWLPAKRLNINFMTPNFKTGKGRTRLFAAIDELAFFNTDSENRVQANADETYQTLVASLETIRSACDKLRSLGAINPPDGLQINIGSPYEANDKMMQLLRESKEKKKSMGFHYATWDFNPNIRKDSQGMLEMRQKKGDIVFMRDFGAEPPLAANPLIELAPAVLVRNAVTDREPLFRADVVERKDAKGYSYLTAVLKNVIKDDSAARVLTVDTGENMNSFAIGMGSIAFEDEEKIRYDAGICVTPSRDLSISFPFMFEVIDELIKTYNVLHVKYDRWQSVQQVQTINNTEYKHIRGNGPIAERCTLTYNDFDEIRDTAMSQDRILLPKTEVPFDIDKNSGLLVDFNRYKNAGPISHLVLQMLTVRHVGRRVMKPIDDDDDIFRTWALAVNHLLQPEVVEEYRKYAKMGARARESAMLGLGVVLKRSLTRSSGNGSGMIGNLGGYFPMRTQKRGSK